MFLYTLLRVLLINNFFVLQQKRRKPTQISSSMYLNKARKTQFHFGWESLSSARVYSRTSRVLMVQRRATTEREHSPICYSKTRKAADETRERDKKREASVQMCRLAKHTWRVPFCQYKNIRERGSSVIYASPSLLSTCDICAVAYIHQ